MMVCLLGFLVAVVSVQLPPRDVPTLTLLGASPTTPLVGLSVKSAVAMALSKNTDIVVEQEKHRIAQYRIEVAKGAYDISLHITPSYTFRELPVTSNIFAGPNTTPIEQSIMQTEMSLSGQTRSGTKYSLGGSSAVVHDNTSINNFDPYYTTSLRLRLSQPLLRGAGNDDAKQHLELARVNADLSTDQMAFTASTTLARVLNTYYDLTAAWSKIAIEEDGLLQAKAFSERSERLIKTGKSLPINVTEANAQVYKFRNRVFSAFQKVVQLQNQLKQLIVSDTTDPIWDANIVPTSPMIAQASEPSLNDIIVAAIKNRPEIRQVHEVRRGADLHLADAKEQEKPEVTLGLEVAENGFAGAAADPTINPLNLLLPPGVTLPLPPGYENGKSGQAWSNTFNGRFPEYRLGVMIALPLRNRAARAEVAIATSEKKTIDVQEIALLQRIEAEARNALENYRSASERLSSTKAQEDDTDVVLHDEERRYAVGRSQPLIVLYRQLNLITAREDELQAQTDLQQAEVELDHVSGTLLQRYNVDISD